MITSANKFYLHVTAVPKSVGIERHPFTNLIIDQLRPLIGDQSGHCHVEIIQRLFTNPIFVIAVDDNFTSMGLHFHFTKK